jgi:hypothetical protein
MAEEKFIRLEHRSNIIIESDPYILVEKLLAFKPDYVDSKWIEHLKKNNKYE